MVRSSKLFGEIDGLESRITGAIGDAFTALSGLLDLRYVAVIDGRKVGPCITLSKINKMPTSVYIDHENHLPIDS